MTMSSETLTVKHSTGKYPILVEPKSLDALGEQFERRSLKSPVGIVTNRRVNDLYGDRIREGLRGAGFVTRTVLMPDGERYKNLATVEQLINALLKQKMERNGTILALGGGVTGDVTGFVASILFRGVRWVQVPTTLLAQVDASVGGKTGVNHEFGKNIIGAFHQPELVVIDPEVNLTLETRDRLSGYAEMLKMAFILDPSFLDVLIKYRDKIIDGDDVNMLSRAISRSVALKAQIVTEDERESNRRRVLNFGHTFAHALEKVTEYKRYRHGEAVLLGMYAAGWLSNQVSGLSNDNWEIMRSILRDVPFDQQVDDLDAAKVVAAMEGDKKTRHDRINYVLLKRFGDVTITDAVSPTAAQLAVQAMKVAFSNSGDTDDESTSYANVSATGKL